MLDGIFGSVYASGMTVPAFIATCLLALVLGLGIAQVYRWISPEGGTMTTALTVLPFLVQLVILLVNGNLGAGVAVAGAFSLVRFRSAPGSARDIMAIFLAMTVGLSCGMGYCALAVLAAVVTCLVFLLEKQPAQDPGERELRVTVPENLNYGEIFDDLFEDYTTSAQLVRVKTVNMGSLYSLHYRVRLKDVSKEKQMLDDMRCRNGNLEISCGLPASEKRGDIL